MTKSPLLTICNKFTRPSESDILSFADAPTGWVADSIGRRGALPYWIQPLTDKKRFIGSAITAQSRPGDNLAPYAALKFAQPGDVLVVSTDGDEDVSVLGDILLGMAKNSGIAGVVTDGLVRDIAGLNAVGIPVFARALSPNSPVKDGPATVGLPITLGGVSISSGDMLVGDADGVVVVPAEKISEASARLKTIADKEAEMDKAVAAGVKYPRWIDEILESEEISYID